MFINFEANTTNDLNNKIRYYCEDNNFVEIGRSAPAIISQDDVIKIWVTVNLRPMSSDEIVDSEDIRKRRTLKTPITEMNLSLRVLSCLYKEGHKTIEDLLEPSYNCLKKIKHLGPKGREEVISKIDLFGLKINY